VKGSRLLRGEEEEQWRALHQAVADKFGMTIREVAIVAKRLAIRDPLHFVYGQPIIIEPEKPPTSRACVDPENVDLLALTDVPEPFAQCDLMNALWDYERDCMSCALLLRHGERTEQVINNQLGWARFLAVRHPDALMREWFAEFEQAILAGEVEAWARRVKADCERLGFTVTSDATALTMKVGTRDGE
jgi:hypothetical protein